MEFLQTPTNINYLQSLPAEKLSRVRATANAMRHGLHTSAPLTCSGPVSCPFIEHCPIPQKNAMGGFIYVDGEIDYGDIKDYPVNQQCVMESLYMQQKIYDYVEYLEVSPSNPVEMSIVNELALIDLYKNRALIFFSKGDKNKQGQDFLLRDVSIDPETGLETTSTKLHPLADMIDKLEKRRERWLDKLIETRKGKFTMATKLGAAQENSEILSEIRRLREVIDNHKDVIEVMEVKLDD